MMFVFGANSASTGYNLTRSLRFRASASAYLNRTPSVAGNQQKFTWSGWIKRGKLSSEQAIIVCRTGSSTEFGRLVFNSSDQLDFWVRNSSSTTLLRLVTTQVFRDPSAWYHVVMYVDTTQATAANRAIFYINGVQVTAYGTATYPSQNTNLDFNTANLTAIGVEVPNSTYFDGYLAEVNFIDGQALTPSSFGSTNALTGVWQPARYTGTYGTNGFYLPFTDNSALTTSSNVGLGKDFSGNGNYWTTNNISITAGVTYDSMTDVPTLTSATAANFAVLNPVAGSPGGTLNNGNLHYTISSAATTNYVSTIAIPPSTGKWYWEVTLDASGQDRDTLGMVRTPQNSSTMPDQYNDTSWNYIYSALGFLRQYNQTTVATYSTITSGQSIGVCFDAVTGKVWLNINGTYANSGNPVAGTGQVLTIATGVSWFPILGNYGANTNSSINFGQRPFALTQPAGFVSLNTFNLPTSTIVKGNTVMDATLYTGTGAALSVTNAASFQPDLVWMKGRSGATDHALYDSVRGVQNQLESNTTTAETAEATGLTAFGSGGFTVGALAQVNTSAATYVGWQWQAGQGTTSSNTNGNVTSTVSVNASAGFSVVTYTVTSTASMTIGHGLGVAPQLIIEKRRDGAANWDVYTAATGNTGRLILNSINAFDVQAGVWNNTTPTSTVFSQQGNGTWHPIGATCVAYCWTPIAGYSAFGSFAGNGSTNGPFIYTGFRPKFIIYKNTTDLGGWVISDTARGTYNLNDPILGAQTSDAETTGNFIDILSNGFKFRATSGTGINGSGQTYIYIAFAENPTKYALAR
jgi:hypothetical protein